MASISIGEELKESGERGIVHFISICVKIPFASKQTTLCFYCFLVSRICKYLVSKFSNFDMRITTGVCGLRVFASLFIAILSYRLPNNDSVYSTSCLFIIAPGFMKNCQVLRNYANMCKFWWTNDGHTRCRGALNKAQLEYFVQFYFELLYDFLIKVSNYNHSFLVDNVSMLTWACALLLDFRCETEILHLLTSIYHLNW